MKVRGCILLFLLFLASGVSAADRDVFFRYLDEIREWDAGMPDGDWIVRTATFFLEAPYVAATLEVEPEALVVNLREFDCMTFVETVLTLARTARGKEPSYEAYCRNLQQLRYRGGAIDGYVSRLHYTSDWVYENVKAGRMIDVTQLIGGQPLQLYLSFMSTHPDNYKQLRVSPDLVCFMAEKEKEISARPYYYIPKDRIDACAGGMQEGDLVCFTTTIKGLDVSHVGIVHRVGEKLTFIHASSSGKVILNKDSMAAYAQAVKRNSGVIIVRPWLSY